MRNWKIGTRMGLGFAVVLLLMLLSSGLALWRLQSLTERAEDMATSAVPMERTAREWLLGTSNNLVRTVAMVKSHEPELQSYLKKEMDAASAEITRSQKKLESLLTEDEERALMKEISARRTKYIDTRNALLKLKADGRQEEAVKMTDAQLLPLVEQYRAGLAEMVGMQVKRMNDSAAAIEQLNASTRTLLLVASALALALGACIAWLLTRSVSRPLAEAVRVAEAVAGGDLTTRVEVRSRDETGQLMAALRHMNDSLSGVVAKVRAGTDTIATASAQIATGNQDLSQRTEEQASSLEETAASMEELTGTVKQNADNARQANQLAQAASKVASEGGSVVGEVVQTMGEIHGASKKIVDIISVIDGIAFQTNILALNAAVEAARAGEQGRGFAVVAQEVRSLAQRSAAAAKEIKGLIDDSVSKVESGSALVDQAGRTMQEVVGSIQRVTDIMGEIAAATDEQTRGIEQVNAAITQMDQVTQQNAALVEEAAAAAQSMREQAASLVDAVGVFRTDAEGQAQRVISAIQSASKLPAPARPAQAARAELPAPAAAKRHRRPRDSAPAGDAEDWREF